MKKERKNDNIYIFYTTNQEMQFGFAQFTLQREQSQRKFYSNGLMLSRKVRPHGVPQIKGVI